MIHNERTFTTGVPSKVPQCSPDGVISVEHPKSHTSTLEVMDHLLYASTPVSWCPTDLQLSNPRHHKVHSLVLEKCSSCTTVPSGCTKSHNHYNEYPQLYKEKEPRN